MNAKWFIIAILSDEGLCFAVSSPERFRWFKNRQLYPKLHRRDEICGPNRPCRLPLLMPDKPTL